MSARPANVEPALPAQRQRRPPTDVADLVAHVVPRAACLAERVNAPWLQAAPGATDGSARLWCRWVSQAARGDENAFAALLERRGIDPCRARRGLGPVGLHPAVELPDWAAALSELLAAASSPADPRDVQLARSLTSAGRVMVAGGVSPAGSEASGAAALAGFVRWAREVIRRSAVAVPADLEDSLVLLLLRPALQLSRWSGTDLDRPADAAESPVATWATVLTEAPALGRLLGVIAVHWRLFAVELLDRIRSDAGTLASLVGDRPGAPPVTVRVGPAEGDRHNGGRAVVPVYVGAGRLYYKPKDLRVNRAVEELLALLGGDLSLPQSVPMPGYGWEVPADPAPPADDAAWRAVARQLGMWARLLDVLGATDMFAGNVVITGDRVVPVDVETIMPFLFEPAEAVPWAPAGSRTFLLTDPMLMRACVRVPDFGLLAETANASLLDHVDDIRAGFADMHQRLVARRAEVLAVLTGWKDLPVRAVIRNTWVYQRLLIDSLTGDALADGVARDLVLERLWRAQPRLGIPVAVVEGEVAALRDFDTPLFTFRAGDRDLIGPAGVARDALPDPPLDGLRRRLCALTPDPEPADLDGIATQAFCAAPGYRPLDTCRAATFRQRDDEDVDWAREARRAGRQILTLLRRGGPASQRLAAGLHYVANNDVLTLVPRRSSDLFSGSGGLAVVLAELQTLGGSGFAAEASRLATDVVDALHAQLEELAAWNRTGGDRPVCGMHWGLPASVYAVCALPSELLPGGSRRLLDRAADVLGNVHAHGCWRPDGLDEAAAVLLALDTMTRTGHPVDLRARERVAAVVADGWPTRPPHTWRVTPVGALLPSARGCAALALHRHGTTTGSGLPSAARRWLAERNPDTDGDRLVLAAAGRPVDGRAAPETSLECLAALDETLLGFRRSGDRAALVTAQRVGKEILRRHRRHRRWFPESLAADRYRLSAVWGLAAVAHGFASLAGPDRAYSLRLLEPPTSATRPASR